MRRHSVIVSTWRGAYRISRESSPSVVSKRRGRRWTSRQLKHCTRKSSPPSIISISPPTMRICETFDEEVINLLSKTADFQVIRPEAIGEEYVEKYKAAKDSAAEAPRRPGPRRGASADAAELRLRRGASPDIEVPIRRNWIEGATFAQSIWNRSSIAAAGIAAAASMTINTREGILDRDPLRTSRGWAAKPQARG